MVLCIPTDTLVQMTIFAASPLQSIQHGSNFSQIGYSAGIYPGSFQHVQQASQMARRQQVAVRPACDPLLHLYCDVLIHQISSAPPSFSSTFVHVYINMSDKLREFTDLPREFVKEGTQVCTRISAWSESGGG
jgi:hypothetical protein